MATGRQTLQRPASAREASSSCVTGTSRRVPRPRLHESLGPSLLAAPTPPGPRVATASQDLRLPGRTADQGLPGQTLCVSLCPDPGHAQTSQDGLQPHGGPGGDHGRRCPLCQGGALFSLLRTWSCWPIIVRNLRIVGKSKIYENKLKRSMKMCWEYRPVRCNNKNTRLVSPNIVWTRFNSIFRRFQFPFP